MAIKISHCIFYILSSSALLFLLKLSPLLSISERQYLRPREKV